MNVLDLPARGADDGIGRYYSVMLRAGRFSTCVHTTPDGNAARDRVALLHESGFVRSYVKAHDSKLVGLRDKRLSETQDYPMRSKQRSVRLTTGNLGTVPESAPITPTIDTAMADAWREALVKFNTKH